MNILMLTSNRQSIERVTKKWFCAPVKTEGLYNKHHRHRRATECTSEKRVNVIVSHKLRELVRAPLGMEVRIGQTQSSGDSGESVPAQENEERSVFTWRDKDIVGYHTITENKPLCHMFTFWKQRSHTSAKRVIVLMKQISQEELCEFGYASISKFITANSAVDCHYDMTVTILPTLSYSTSVSYRWLPFIEQRKVTPLLVKDMYYTLGLYSHFCAQVGLYFHH